MSFFQGLGAFAGGAAQGYGTAEKIKTIQQERKEQEAQSKGMQEFFKRLKEETPSSVENPMPQDGQSQGQLPSNLAGLDYVSPQVKDTMVVQQFADGGMVQDPKSFVSQVNSPAGLEAVKQPSAQPVKSNPSDPNRLSKLEKMQNAYYAAAQTALDAGGTTSAKDFLNLGFKLEDEVYKRRSAQALNSFDLTGDVGALVPIYNQNIPDGYSIVGHEKNQDGTYKLKFRTPDNQEVEQSMTKDQIMQYASSMDDPATRYAMRAKSILEREGEKFKTDEEIRKQKALEAGKVHTVGLDSVAYKNDGTIVYDGSKREKPDAWKNNFMSVGGGYMQKNADGSVSYSQTKGTGSDSSSGGKAKDYNKDMLPVLKEVGDSILGFEGMGTQDMATGKVMPTTAGNEALVFGQRLIKQNPNLVPSEAAKLAHIAVTQPNAVKNAVYEENGMRYKTQVINYGGRIYELGSAKTEVKDAPKKRQTTQLTSQTQPQKTPSLNQRISQGQAFTPPQDGEQVGIGLDSLKTNIIPRNSRL